MIRLAQLYTGKVGSAVIRRLARHPSIELVAVLVHSAEKAGRDSGEVAGSAPNGILTSSDIDEVLAVRPDAAIYAGLNPDYEFMAHALRAGVNLYSGIGGFYHRGTPQFDLIDGAAREGGVSFTGGGNIPGLVPDVFPLFLSGYTGRVRELRARQWNDVSDYPSVVQINHRLGIGKLPDEDPDMAAAVDRGFTDGMFRSARMVADALGVECSAFELVERRIALAPHDVVLPGSGLFVRQGTVAGIEWNWIGYTNGRPFYRLTNQQSAMLRLGDGWRQNHDEPAWRVEIDGEPPIVATFGWPPDVAPGEANFNLNVSRAINTIPHIVAARPGCVSVLDHPAPVATDGLFV